MLLTAPLSPAGLGRATNHRGSGKNQVAEKHKVPTNSLLPRGRGPKSNPHLERMPNREGALGGKRRAQVQGATGFPRTEETPATRRGRSQLSRTLFSAGCKQSGAELCTSSLGGASQPKAPMLNGFSGVLQGMEGRAPLGRTAHSPRKS